MTRTATNPETGETVVLDGNEWKPASKTATNDKGQKAYFVGDKWVVDDTAPTQPQAPIPPSVGDQARSILGKKSLLEQYNPMSAVAEPIMKMGTGMIAKPVSDVMGLAALAKARLTGDNEADVSGFKDYVQQGLTYEPRTAIGKSPFNPLNAIPNAIGSVIGGASNKAADVVGGGAEADTARGMTANAVREAIPHALAIAGAKYAPKASGKASAKLQASEALKKQKAVGEIPKQVNVIEAKDAGFKLPPSEAGGGRFARTVEGVSGRPKLIDSLEDFNSKRATKIIHDDLGLPEHVPLTSGAVEEVIKEAGKTYGKIRDLDKPFVADKRYITDLTNLNAKVVARRKNATTWNPEFATILNDMKKSIRNPSEAVDLMQSLRAESSQNFAAVEKGLSAKPNQQALAKFQKEAAKSLEDMVHRNLEQRGMKDLSTEFLKSRQTIAKGKTIQKVLDENGIINAEKLGHLKERGAYMTGEMDKVAKFGRAFPDVAGKPKAGAKIPLTGQEGMLGAVGTVAGLAHPLGWGITAYPALKIGARTVLESGPGQKMIGMPKAYTPGTLSNVMQQFSQLSPEAQQAMAYSLMQPGQQ